MKIITYTFYLIGALLLMPIILLKPVFQYPKDTFCRLILILLSEVNEHE